MAISSLNDASTFAAFSGAEIKLDWISPGSRVGFYGNFGVGAAAYSGGALLNSPGLFGSGNQVAWGFITDSVYVNGSAQQQTTAWTVGAANRPASPSPSGARR